MAGFEGFEWIVFNHFNTKILPVCSRKIRFPRLYFSIKFLDKTVPFVVLIVIAQISLIIVP